MEINSDHDCVYCNVKHGEGKTNVSCDVGAGHHYQPSGDTVLLGQIIEGSAVVSIPESLTADEIALLMAAFMDRISTFEHIKRDPSVIMNALMKGMS